MGVQGWRGGGKCLAMHFPKRGLTHLLLSVALARGCIEHGAFFELFACILHAVAGDNLLGVIDAFEKM